jgi:hypothetical protein
MRASLERVTLSRCSHHESHWQTVCAGTVGAFEGAAPHCSEHGTGVGQEPGEPRDTSRSGQKAIVGRKSEVRVVQRMEMSWVVIDSAHPSCSTEAGSAGGRVCRAEVTTVTTGAQAE